MTQRNVKMSGSRLLSLFAIFFIASMFTGCTTKTKMRCIYKPGDVDKIRFISGFDYKTWVEMPKKDKSNLNGRVSQREIVVSREVQSVEPDGSAIMKVTIESVKLSVTSKVEKKETKRSYISTGTENKTDFPGEPALAGTVYTIRIQPDTTVESIVELDNVLGKLGVTAESATVVSELLSPASIKQLHQCDFVAFGPASVSDEMTYNKNVPIKGQMPDNIIKAQALNKTYTVQPIAEGTGQVVVAIGGEPLYVSPEGFEKLQEPSDMGMSMIKNSSVMDELTITGQGVFDLTTCKVVKTEDNINCKLILDGNDLGFGGQSKKNAKKGSQGFMYTTLKLFRSYEVIN